jgi:predicted RNase H-like HicB family nuclease
MAGAKRTSNEMLRIEIDREEDGRWISEVPELRGGMVYGAAREEAQTKVEALALPHLPTASSTVRKFPRLAISSSSPHER